MNKESSIAACDEDEALQVVQQDEPRDDLHEGEEEGSDEA